MVKKINKVIYGSLHLPLKVGSSDIRCYILDNKQRVITQLSFQKALGYDGKSEEWLLDFLSSVNKFYPISGDLLAAYENPILFELKADDLTSIINKGLTPPTILATCAAITSAKKDGYLNVSQLKFAKSAEHLERFLLQHSFNALIDEATGFTFFKESAMLYLQQMLQNRYPDKIFDWTRTIPEELLEKLLEIHHLYWSDLRTNPEAIATILLDVIFCRIPESLVAELQSQSPKRTYKRKSGLPHFTHPDLKAYVVEIMALMNASNDNWNIFLQLLNRTYPRSNSLANHSVAVQLKSAEAIQPLNSLDQNLLKGVLVNHIYKKGR